MWRGSSCGVSSFCSVLPSLLFNHFQYFSIPLHFAASTYLSRCWNSCECVWEREREWVLQHHHQHQQLPQLKFRASSYTQLSHAVESLFPMLPLPLLVKKNIIFFFFLKLFDSTIIICFTWQDYDGIDNGWWWIPKGGHALRESNQSLLWLRLNCHLRHLMKPGNLPRIPSWVYHIIILFIYLFIISWIGTCASFS